MKVIIEPFVSRTGEHKWNITIHREWNERPKMYSGFIINVKDHIRGFEYLNSDWLGPCIQKTCDDILDIPNVISELTKRYRNIRHLFYSLPKRQTQRIH